MGSSATGWFDVCLVRAVPGFVYMFYIRYNSRKNGRAASVNLTYNQDAFLCKCSLLLKPTKHEK